MATTAMVSAFFPRYARPVMSVLRSGTWSALLFASLLSCRGGEVVETAFPTAAAARAAGSPGIELYPRAMPPMATDLHEAHDLDARRSVGRFRLSGTSARGFGRDLRVVGLGERFGPPCRPSALGLCSVPDWWPPSLDDDSFTGAQLASHGYLVVEDPSGTERDVLAIDQSSGDVLFWRSR